jgi:hypothetical protein
LQRRKLGDRCLLGVDPGDKRDQIGAGGFPLLLGAGDLALDQFPRESVVAIVRLGNLADKALLLLVQLGDQTAGRLAISNQGGTGRRAASATTWGRSGRVKSLP